MAFAFKTCKHIRCAKQPRGCRRPQLQACGASLWSTQHPHIQGVEKTASHCPGLRGCCSLTTHLLWVVLIAEEFQCVDASIKRPLQALRKDECPLPAQQHAGSCSSRLKQAARQWHSRNSKSTTQAVRSSCAKTCSDTQNASLLDSTLSAADEAGMQTDSDLALALLR